MAGNARTAPRLVVLATGLWLAACFSSAWPGAAAQSPPPHEAPASFFQTADGCMACHNGLVSPSGEDVSIGTSWRASMMANSARDPYWHAAVRREVIDNPGAASAIEDECSKCHMPMARFEAHAAGGQGSVFSHLPIGTGAREEDRLAADGVSCTVCHQIEPANFGERSSFVGGFQIDTVRGPDERPIYGSFEVEDGLANLMRSATGFRPTEATHVQRSELCATCHTLITHALGADGQVVGELPEQVPYQEWLHSGYRTEKSCQDCHMPVVETPTRITSVLGEPREGFARHEFRGGNFFMLRMLNRYRADLGVEALPQELDNAVRQTVHHLQSDTAAVTVEPTGLGDGRLQVDVVLTNLAGHKFPTAYPSRRAWLQLTVRDRQRRVVFESGALTPEGRIVGNDNDDDPARYEPHHTAISTADQVQIYEAIMAGVDGRVTTGLLTAVRFVKDNRLLPAGFAKTTAGEDIAVHGRASEDDDFAAGGDRIRYSVLVDEVEGPFEVEATLWFQPISYRWARNLAPYKAPEIDRFVTYYESMAGVSAVAVTRATATVVASGSRRSEAEPR